MGEDESHSGDGSVDLFTEEELLPLSGSSFRRGTRPWHVSAKPKTPTEDITTTQDVLKTHNSTLTLAKPIQATTESLTKPKAAQFSTVTDNLRGIWSTTHTTPQTLPGIEHKREETTAQMMLSTESASSHLKIKSNSASSETRGNNIASTVAAIISQSEVSKETLTEQSNTGTFSRENFSQDNEQTTRETSSLITPSQRAVTPESSSTTIRMKTGAEMSAASTDSGTNIIQTASGGNEDEIDPSTTVPMTTNTLVNKATAAAAVTGKRRKHSSTGFIRKQQGSKQTSSRNGKDEDVQEKPQRQPGKH